MGSNATKKSLELSKLGAAEQMSPRPPSPIEELGGLSDSQIQLLISENNVKWGQSMSEYTQRFEDRMDAHEKIVTERFEKSEEKTDNRLSVTEEKIDVTLTRVNEIAELVRESNRRQHQWHKADLTYRAMVESKLTAQDSAIAENRALSIITGEKTDTMVAEVTAISNRMKLISWVVMTTKGVQITAQTLISTAKEGKQLANAVAAFSSAALLIWTFFYRMLPVIKIWLKSH